MIDAKLVAGLVEEHLAGSGLFLVEVKISTCNDIDVTIEAENRDVNIGDCTEMNNYLCSRLDRDIEDYSLTVGSAGLTQSFKVPGQYRKAQGNEVELLVKGGRKIKNAMLEKAETDKITVSYVTLEQVAGKKRRLAVKHTESFGYEELLSVKNVIDF
ncbi:MAG: ribosome assembly cofactor RimP [Bacteroidales bacterium]|jgi:ribosome maturation factor RimP|nr:ribosome assembly cofactor RimP [Bacteroidales bacterium]MCI2121354.1 ribosome assembly cofactor RimP [Bacteroidales bacterium]MCI2145245.1 ribosome assembly cofactor RimP [Bacteroidales bacterium]